MQSSSSRSTEYQLPNFSHSHHFNTENSTFIDNSGNVKSLEDLKEDLKKTVIKGASANEIQLTDRRREKLAGIELPSDIQQWFEDPDNSFKTSRFLTTFNMDVLSQTGVLVVQYFGQNQIQGITLAAHILFYEIPFLPGESRPDVSRHWITTLAYQLMLNMPELTIPVLEALHLDPLIPLYNSLEQLQALVIRPLRAVIDEGIFKRKEILLIHLDCIDCSMNALSLAADIAYLIRELQSLHELRFRFLITGTPQESVCSTFRNVPIEILDLQQPKRTPLYVAERIQFRGELIIMNFPSSSIYRDTFTLWETTNMESSYPSTQPVTQQQAFGSFSHAHDFIVSNSTFIDNSGNTR
ncbi:hypothetical protein BDQ17DRAFT_1428589 [Cyathus striatus]|nr:hypothetical protein BDQ17DRAFT_1428589 [Cyathus striatus]